MLLLQQPQWYKLAEVTHELLLHQCASRNRPVLIQHRFVTDTLIVTQYELYVSRFLH